MLDVSALVWRARTTPSRAEKRRLLKEDRKHRGADEPGLALAPVDVRSDDVQDIARACDPETRMLLYAIIDGRAEPYLTFEQFVDRAHPGYLWGAHLTAVARRLQDVADGLLRRLMVFMPPRHGKSELISRLFTAYYVYRHPARDVALTTYGAELSYDLSRDARTNYLQLGGSLASDSAAIKSWHTAGGGNVWATGVGGPATGRGYHLGIIDDPYKDHEEAASAKIRRTRLDWYRSVFRTRAAPGAAVILLMTRWHMDDLAANLLREEAVTRLGWHVIEMPAEKRAEPVDTQAGHDPHDVAASLDALLDGRVDPVTGAVNARGRYKWPDSVTIEPDARDDARWLWTQRFTPDEYASLKRELGGESGYFWNALYQQRPVPNAGGMFKREWFKPIARAQLPPFVLVGRWWDLGATEDAGAFTAGLRVGKDRDGNFYITGLEHGQWHVGRRDRIIQATARRDGPRVRQLFPQDPGAAGKDVASKFVRLLSGISPTTTVLESGDKELRATLPASDAANGLFFIVAEPWAAIVLQELADFGPGAEFRDIVDALSGVHAYLSGRTKRRETQGSVSMRSTRR
jgi:predicted phage terminase large subunit-like protein